MILHQKKVYTKTFHNEVFYKCLRYRNKLHIKIGKLMSEKDLISISDEISTK